MPDYLLDGNHLSAALRKVSPMRERIHQGRTAGHRFIFLLHGGAFAGLTTFAVMAVPACSGAVSHDAFASFKPSASADRG
jgi:hypothetical protein